MVERFTWAEGLSGSLAIDVLEDREGNVWVATEGGLDRFRNRNLTWARNRDDAAPVSLVAGNNGDILALAPWPPSLVRVQDGKAVAGAPTVLFTGFHHPDGAIWVAARDSFWRWKGDRFSKLNPPDVAIARRIPFRVLAVTTDRSDRLWVSLGGIGEFYLKEGKWTFVEVLPGRPDMTAIAAYTDEADRVWLAYRDELAAIERDKVRVFSKTDGLGVGALLALSGRDRHIWVGGESGLALFHDGRFHTVRIAMAGGFGSVTGIVVAKSGVWLSTGSGIVHIPEEEVERVLRDPEYPVHAEVLDLVSDLPEPLQMRNNGEAFNAAVEGTDGLLWFVTTNGVARVDPNVSPATRFHPPSSSDRSWPTTSRIHRERRSRCRRFRRRSASTTAHSASPSPNASSSATGSRDGNRSGTMPTHAAPRSIRSSALAHMGFASLRATTTACGTKPGRRSRSPLRLPGSRRCGFGASLPYR